MSDSVNISRIARRLLEHITNDSAPGLHIFHTSECGDGPIETVKENDWEYDVVGGFQCPLLRQSIGLSQKAVDHAMKELTLRGIVEFQPGDPGWVYPKLLRFDWSFPKKKPRSPQQPKELRRLPSARLRFEIFRRDGFTCTYCGRKPPEVELEPDHVVPYSKGGLTVPENLVTACRPCNSGKSNVEAFR